MDKDLRIFLILVFAACCLASVIVYVTGAKDSPYIQLCGLAVMFAPALSAVLAAKLTSRKLGTLGWRRFPVKEIVFGVAAVVLMSWLVMLLGLYFFTGNISLIPGLNPDASGLLHPLKEMKIGEILTVGDFWLKVGTKLLIGLAIVSIFTAGEEVGWRGYMLPRLEKSFGTRKGLILSAVIWAAWHIPYAISGIHHVPGVPAWIILLIAPIGHVGVGLFIGVLTIKTRSIWVPILAHGAMNNWSQFPFRWFIDLKDSDNLVLLTSQHLGFVLLGLLTPHFQFEIVEATLD